MLHALSRLLAAGAASALLAPAGAAPERPDPADPRAATPPHVWRSALDGYRRSTGALPERSWRETNDTAARAGGWRAYAREAQGAAGAASAPAPTHRH